MKINTKWSTLLLYNIQYSSENTSVAEKEPSMDLLEKEKKKRLLIVIYRQMLRFFRAQN